MLRGLTLPATLSRVLDPLRPCFTAPTFETFTALVAGLVAQPVSRTVCGMLSGAGLAREAYSELGKLPALQQVRALAS